MRVILNWLSFRRSTVLIVASGLRTQESVGFRITGGAGEGGVHFVVVGVCCLAN